MKLTARVIIVMVTFSLAEAGKAQPVDYPPSRQVDVVDDYQGVKISDPYRWLEDLNSAETKAWINAQNAIAIKYLESLPTWCRVIRSSTQLRCKHCRDAEGPH